MFRWPTQFNARSDCRPSVADPKRGQPAHSLSTVPARQYVLGGLPGGARHLSHAGQGGPRDACSSFGNRYGGGTRVPRALPLRAEPAVPRSQSHGTAVSRRGVHDVVRGLPRTRYATRVRRVLFCRTDVRNVAFEWHTADRSRLGIVGLLRADGGAALRQQSRTWRCCAWTCFSWSSWQSRFRGSCSSAGGSHV